MHAAQRWIPLALFVLSTCLYLLTLQRAIYGDGIFFEPKLTTGQLVYGQILYLPLVWTVWSGLDAVAGISAETALKVVSAIAGGTGVALTYLAARRVLASQTWALAAALLLMGFFGYWFHATATELHGVHSACAVVLFLGLILTLEAARTARTADAISGTTLWLLFLGTVLTLASHTSGIAMLPAILYVAWRARSVRGHVLVAIGAGLVAFAICYLWLAFGNKELQRYAGDHAAKMASILTTPQTLVPKTIGAARELLLYALPAATLVPAGLRVLFRTAPEQGWLCLLWLVSWPLVVLPVGDFAYGSYHLPTFPLQALLAVVACRALATSIPRALLVLVLAFLPALPLVLVLVPALSPGPGAMGLALIVWLAAAAVLFLTVRDDDRRPRWPLALPLTSIVLSAILLPPFLRQDPIRDRIHAVTNAVDTQDLVIYLADDVVTWQHWRRFFPGATGPDRRALNLRLLDRQPAAQRSRLQNVLSSWVQEALAGRRPLWLAGDLSNPSGSKPFQNACELLRSQFRFRTPENAPQHLFRLVPRN
ncbi:MAG: hypothetical protein ACYTGO_05145 [Planctomycetota bacterium]